MAEKQIQLKGRVFLTFNIEAVTGLHIGGSETGIEIGGVDKVVIRDPITNRPYIPGSSLKGKVRSLLEKYRGLPLNRNIGGTAIHTCDSAGGYRDCDVCQVFGVPGEMDFATPTRLVVRDVHLTEKSAQDLTERAHTDLPYTEVKTEVSIDRVTSAANPRRMERVPAGAVFGPAELVYSVYEGTDGNAVIADPRKDVARFRTLVEGLQLLEDDYLGGLGSRGSGKVKLAGLTVSVRSHTNYLEARQEVGKYDDLAGLVSDLDNLLRKVMGALGLA
ncbi:MAG: type III-A CRISPR-associated RAMP protein Csm3 [Anaerolineae bacterium]|jgi:CRISPR-associated protein Csm3